MSYCRWSSDNFKCDIYAYESVYGGYEIHVAHSRYKGVVPEVDMSFFENNTAENVQKFLESRKIQSAYLETCETEPIGLPCDGESYNMPDLQSFLQKMLQLKCIGYNIPDRVLESIKNELNPLNPHTMSKEEILEGNRLIAEFMGYKPRFVEYPDRALNAWEIDAGGYWIAPKYHTSWDWLMPVVERIETMDNKSYGFSIDPFGMSVIEYVSGDEKVLAEFLNDDNYPKIQQYYETVIQFIKWHNQHPKQ